MLLRHCRTCDCYIMDDGHEVSCRYSDDIAYYEIKPSAAGALVHHCPLAGRKPRRSEENSQASRDSGTVRSLRPKR